MNHTKTIITCKNEGVEWNGTFFDKKRIEAFLVRLRNNPRVTEIVVTETKDDGK